MATHSNTLAWKIPWTEEPGRLQSMGSLRVGHDWATSLSCIGEGNGNPLQCSCLENPRDGGAWWAAVYGVAQSRTWLKRLSSSSRTSEEVFPHAPGEGFSEASLWLPAWPIYEMLTPRGRQAYGSLLCWTLTPLSCCCRYWYYCRRWTPDTYMWNMTGDLIFSLTTWVII